MYEHGWQPGDIAHFVRGKCTVRAARLMSALIASDARGTDAAHRAPQAWLDQLEDLGLYDATRSAIVGGYDSAVAPAMSPEQAERARGNFALVQVRLVELDWLHLAASGHRRAGFRREGERWLQEWRQP